jgi:succinoglycan biosynthesis protein ExoO
MTDSSPTITVLIAAYNCAGFIARAIGSALNQSISVLEVLVVDDASSDDSAAVVAAMAHEDARIRLISLAQNGGPAKARNVGLNHARGDWVAILDADDAMLPDRLEQMRDIALQHHADVVVDNFRWYAPATAISPERIGAPGIAVSDAVEVVSVETYVAHARPFRPEMDWGLLKPMLRRDFLVTHQVRYPENSRHGEDLLFIIDLLLKGGRYVLSRVPGYLYTHRSSGMSRTTVNYDVMITHTLALLKDDRVRQNHRLRQALLERTAALRQLRAEWWLRTYLDQRHLVAIARLVLLDHRAMKALIRVVWARLSHRHQRATPA